MRILFDQGTPVPLRRSLIQHQVKTAFEQGWARFQNGDLLAAAETHFDLFVTTDKNLRYQQNVFGRSLAILVLPTTSWPKMRERIAEIVIIIESIKPGDYHEMNWTD